MAKIFAVFDVKADAYRSLFVMNTKAQAIRAFSDLAHDVGTDVGKHPEDYRLVVLAEFDESSGRISPVDVPESLGFATEWISSRKE